MFIKTQTFVSICNFFFETIEELLKPSVVRKFMEMALITSSQFTTCLLWLDWFVFGSSSESGILFKPYSTTFHRPFTCLAMFWEWPTNDHTFSHYEIRLDIQVLIVFYSRSLGPYIRVAKSKLMTTACQSDSTEEWTWNSCVSLLNAVVKMQIKSGSDLHKNHWGYVSMKFSANCPFSWLVAFLSAFYKTISHKKCNCFIPHMRRE